MLDGCLGLLVEAKAEAAADAHILWKAIYTDQNGDDGDLHIRVSGEGIGEVRVHGMDGEGRRVGERIVMLVSLLRIGGAGQIALRDQNLGNGLAEIGMKDHAHVDPHGHRFVGQFSWFKR